MSPRFIPLAMLLCPTPALAEGDALAMDRYRDIVSVVAKCRANRVDEIVVCGRRQADRYRVPLIEPREEGDPKGEGQHAERLRLQNKTTPCQERGAQQVGCGMVGVHMSVALGSGGMPKFRKPAD